MTAEASAALLRQHLIDPEICIRCNTCEETCPIDAITHDARNYVVDAGTCDGCNACIAPCPTGAIDSWRQVPRARPYTIAEQLGWDTLPAQEALADAQAVAAADAAALPADIAAITSIASQGQGGIAPPPWSAAHPYVNLHTLAKPARPPSAATSD
jgi:benzoyl-CoA 2,3-dioxygenase component A